MKTEDIIAALRCISTPANKLANCASCSYGSLKELDGKPYFSCDVDRIGLDAADRLEELEKTVAKQADELETYFGILLGEGAKA